MYYFHVFEVFFFFFVINSDIEIYISKYYSLLHHISIFISKYMYKNIVHNISKKASIFRAAGQVQPTNRRFYTFTVKFAL